MTGITNMVIPKIEREAESRNYGKFIISPLEQGYGATIGNAMRRALLSSLGGVAITSMRIADVLHEFTDVPGVREDVVQIMLQVKKIRMKLDGVDSTRMHLEVRGEGVVTAADIIAPPEVEVVNPELYLFTVDNNKAKMDIEFSVERGRGYSPANERSGHMPIGEMPVDALFSPVKRVNWDVDYARVGQSTNYDKLMLEIWTDGSIAPEKALSMSGRVLIEHLRHIAGVSEESLMAVIEEEEEEKGVTSEVAETPIEALDLSVRVFNSLKRTGITTVGDVLDLLEKGDQAIMSIRNFGEKSLTELRQKMGEKGFLTDDDEEESEDNAE
ncbi:MAG: DNA-directed RNA polymerase subunit alpha [Anaerolineae bacterium]|nr:DNA-directed RNA polymerase subunit alpha [Anaerolineae bacterium]MBT3713495.1 DNA-directed RNA polymerase subunit alpha [Anaerolineae bacterium]MBT4312107.1 DNA-directed RNA polymerase subunit alpha [Anaerolineae bacterium]MBT4457158.1 DNA-directed RNA polymerase subunit alpha [Anaerolineae bacterium]MBT4843085.1 DNA-directed RNA polymerase subunit alpha [Anaerolineae bacterium]